MTIKKHWIEDTKQEDFFSSIDISSTHIPFDPNIGHSPREIVRDFYDLFFRRRIYQFIYKNYFKNLPYKYDYALPAKGFSNKARINWLNRHKKIKDSRVLIIGVGNGYGIPMWLRYQPKEIVGNDILNYEKAFEVVRKESKSIIDIPIKLFQRDIEDLNAHEIGTFDIIASEAVFEHVRNVEHVAEKCYRLLNTNGVMYASYGGPLWYTWGGDHFSGRENKNNGFNHLLLEQKEYWEYVKANVKPTFETELKAGAGGILVKLDLFSKLNSPQYLEIFQKVGFTVKKLILEFCPTAAEVLKNKEIRDRLIAGHPDCTEDDFKCRAHIILLEKTGSN